MLRIFSKTSPYFAFAAVQFFASKLFWNNSTNCRKRISTLMPLKNSTTFSKIVSASINLFAPKLFEDFSEHFVALLQIFCLQFILRPLHLLPELSVFLSPIFSINFFRNSPILNSAFLPSFCPGTFPKRDSRNSTVLLQRFSKTLPEFVLAAIQPFRQKLLEDYSQTCLSSSSTFSLGILLRHSENFS